MIIYSSPANRVSAPSLTPCYVHLGDGEIQTCDFRQRVYYQLLLAIDKLLNFGHHFETPGK